MREKKRRMTKARNERTVRSDVFVFYPLACLQSPIEWIEQSENRSTGYLIGRFFLLHMISSPQGFKNPFGHVCIIGHTELILRVDNFCIISEMIQKTH